MSRPIRVIRFGVILAGLCFFCNPYFAVVDLLPDFIGCLLIYAGLSRVALIQGEMKEAQTAFLKLAIIDVFKNVALLIVFGATGPNEQATSLLLIGFSAAVIELMFFIPAMRSLFGGFFELAAKNDCVGLYGNDRGGLSYTDRTQKATVVFLILRETLCLLPEFVSLSQSSYHDSVWNRIYDHIGVLRGFACVLVAVIGVFWLVRVCRYLYRFSKEKQALANIGNVYHSYYASHPGIPVERRHRRAFILLFAGSVFLIDFYLDFKNIFPDFIAGVLLLVGALVVSINNRHRIFAAVTAGIYTVVSALSSKSSYEFAINYSVGEIAKDAAASKAYLQMWLLSLAELLSFLVLLAFLLLLLRAVISKWAGYRPEHRSSEFENRCQSSLMAEFDGKLLRCFVFGFVSALLSFLYDYIKELPGAGILRLLNYIWMFDFCAAIVFSVLFASLLSRIYTEIKNRFLFD